MTRKEFVELMEYLYRCKLRRKMFNDEIKDEFRKIILGMSKGYIEHSDSYRKDDRSMDVDYTYAIRRSLQYSSYLAEDIGMIDLLEDYADIIIEGMEFDDLPSEDIETLRLLGELDPRGALLAAFLKVKNQKSLKGSDPEYQSVPIGERLQSALPELKMDLEPVRKGSKPVRGSVGARRWFKGFGKIAQGTALTLADTCLAAGVLVLPVAPSTQTWGAIVSSITGVGMTIDGIGEFRGE